MNGDYLISCDNLKKLYVTNFPNVFNMESVMMEHTKLITHMCPFGNTVATVAEEDADTKT